MVKTLYILYYSINFFLCEHVSMNNGLPSDVVLKHWEAYIDYLIFKTARQMQKYDIWVMSKYKSILMKSHKEIANCPVMSLYVKRELNGPCSYFYKELSSPASLQWTIYTYRSFMVNLTIISAYVPFSEHCHQHYINLLDNISTLFQKLCGQLNKESIYSRNNIVILKMVLTTSQTYRTVNLIGKYQVHMKNTMLSLSPVQVMALDWLVTNWRPAIVLMNLIEIECVWYLSASVYSSQHRAALIPIMI